jgi:hypothetical protein
MGLTGLSAAVALDPTVDEEDALAEEEAEEEAEAMAVGEEEGGGVACEESSGPEEAEEPHLGLGWTTATATASR